LTDLAPHELRAVAGATQSLREIADDARATRLASRSHRRRPTAAAPRHKEVE